jgi:hypothetical protein
VRIVLSPFDDLPIHQIAEPIALVGTSDRNFYDRYYFNLFKRGDGLFVTAGLGQYPNLGVADAFVAATHGGHQYVVRASRELEADRSDATVGPIAVDVLEGLKHLRLRVDGDGPVRLDVTWTGVVPAFQEARHTNRRGLRLTTDTCRFAQTGVWQGRLEIGDERFDVTPELWWGGRDRSWGVRPVGEPEPPGRPRSEGGFLWLYGTMQFDGFTILFIVQEDASGRRSLEQAVRIWPESTGHPPQPFEDLVHDLSFAPGTRRVEHATLTFRRPGDEVTVDVQPVGASYLSLGTGYGTEPDWRHGMYQGPLVVQNLTYDLRDEDVIARTYGLTDALARYEVEGATGYGLFEYAVLGRNERYGFRGRRG